MTDPISLAKWSQREVQTLLGTVARYTRFVWFGKTLLVVAGLGLLAILISVPFLNGNDAGVRIMLPNAPAQKTATAPTMQKPHFQGVDAANQPYSVTADSAVQLDPGRVKLTAPEGDIMLNGNRWLALSAKEGILDLSRKELKMTGKVHLFHDPGYEFMTEEANIDIGRKTAKGSLPVEGQGPLGILHATGFELHSGTGRLFFTGPVTMTVYPGERSEGAR